MNRFDDQVLQPSNRVTRHQQEPLNSKKASSNQSYLENENRKYSADQNQSYLLQGYAQNNTYTDEQQSNDVRIMKQNDQYQGQFNDNPYYNQAVFEQPCRISIITQSQNQNYEQQEYENPRNQQIKSHEPVEQYYNQKERYEDLRQKYYNQSSKQNQGYGNNLYAQASILTQKYQYSQNVDNCQQKAAGQSDQIQESENYGNFSQQEQQQYAQQGVQKNINGQGYSYLNTQSQQQQTRDYQQTFKIEQNRQNNDINQYQKPQINQPNNNYIKISQQQQSKAIIQNKLQQQTSVQMQPKYQERLEYLEQLKRRIPKDDFSTQQYEPKISSYGLDRSAPASYKQNQILPQATNSRMQDQIYTEKKYQSTRVNQQSQQQEYSEKELSRYPKEYAESRKDYNSYERGVREDSYEREKNLFYQKTSHIKQNSLPQHYVRR